MGTTDDTDLFSPGADHAPISRRSFLSAIALASASLLIDIEALAQAPANTTAPFAGGRLKEIIPFAGETKVQARHLFASGLDGRKYTDLSTLTADSLLTPNDAFYVRTGCPDLIDYSVPWVINITPKAGEMHRFAAQKLEPMAKDMGIHLLECSGNVRAGQYGLMSACRWDGVRLLDLLTNLNMPHFERICVSGFDRHSKPSGTTGLVKSTPGASWIFTREQLHATGAFLATKMNGFNLPEDHGYPVRLVVPGWYGCTCIKWVDEIFVVNKDAAATDQMKEFAQRTDQDGIPELARDYKPASIDVAAMPIRIEAWDVDGQTKYNVVGIVWGGQRLCEKLLIRFLPDQTYVPVENYHPSTNATWSLWSYQWSPKAAGSYKIQLKVADAKVACKRLDAGYYIRAVNIV